LAGLAFSGQGNFLLVAAIQRWRLKKSTEEAGEQRKYRGDLRTANVSKQAGTIVAIGVGIW
jgi:hypothetical protein